MSSDPAAPPPSPPGDALQAEASPPPLPPQPRPFVTWLILGISVPATAYLALNRSAPLPVFYASSYEIWSEHRLWTLVTSMFLHGDVLHLFFNGYWLWFLGRILEGHLRGLAYGVFVVTSAWVASIAQLSVGSEMGIGLSGVVYAIFGYVFAARNRVPEFSAALQRGIPLLFFVWLFLCLALDHFGVMPIANAAHFAGIAFGYGLGTLSFSSRARSLATAVGLALSLSFPLVWAPWQAAWHFSRGIKRLERNEGAEAFASFERSLRLDPSNKWALSVRDDLIYSLEDPGQARRALLEVVQRKPRDPGAHNNLAWLLATCPDSGHRDGQAALKHAETACALTDWKEPAYLDTYAAAFAETGDFRNAIVWMEKALQLDNSAPHRAELEAHLDAFKSNRPWREPLGRAVEVSPEK